jgi:hypothetical protein
MILRGKLLLHLSATDPEPVDLDGMDLPERLEDGSPFPYPVNLNFDPRRYIGWAQVERDLDGDLTATVHIDPRQVEIVHAARLTHLAAGYSLIKMTVTAATCVVNRSRLLSVGAGDNNVDPSIPPFEVIES